MRSRGVAVITLDFESSDPSSNLGGTYVMYIYILPSILSACPSPQPLTLQVFCCYFITATTHILGQVYEYHTKVLVHLSLVKYSSISQAK